MSDRLKRASSIFSVRKLPVATTGFFARVLAKASSELLRNCLAVAFVICEALFNVLTVPCVPAIVPAISPQPDVVPKTSSTTPKSLG